MKIIINVSGVVGKEVLSVVELVFDFLGIIKCFLIDDIDVGHFLSFHILS